MNHSEKAEALFYEGYNCAQSVLAAFEDLLPFDRETLLRLSASFGAGVSRLREICGAFSGVCLALGMLYTPENSNDPEQKSAHYRRVQELAAQFREENGSYLCYELLGLPHAAQTPRAEARSKEYYQKRPCASILSNAAAMFDRYVKTHPIDAKEEEDKA